MTLNQQINGYTHSNKPSFDLHRSSKPPGDSGGSLAGNQDDQDKQFVASQPYPFYEIDSDRCMKLPEKSLDWLRRDPQTTAQEPIEDLTYLNERSLVRAAKSAASSPGISRRKAFLQELIQEVTLRIEVLCEEIGVLRNTLSQKPRREFREADKPSTSKAIINPTLAPVIGFAILSTVLFGGELSFTYWNLSLSEMPMAFLVAASITAIPVCLASAYLHYIQPYCPEKSPAFVRRFKILSGVLIGVSLYLTAIKIGVNADIDFSKKIQPWQPETWLVVFVSQISVGLGFYLTLAFLKRAYYSYLGYEYVETVEWSKINADLMAKEKQRDAAVQVHTSLVSALEPILELEKEFVTAYESAYSKQQAAKKKKEANDKARAAIRSLEASIAETAAALFIGLVVFGASGYAQAVEPPTEWVVVLSKDTMASPEAINAFKSQLFSKLGTGVGWLHLFSGEKHGHVGSFEMPADQPERSRFRSKSWKHLLKVHDAFDAPGDSGQINLPAIAETVRQYRRTDLPLKIVLFGSPLYMDKNKTGFSHEPGYVTTDTSIGHERSPFQLDPKLPKGTQINWIAVNPWWFDDDHKKQVTRFNGLFLQGLNATLDRISQDPTIAFTFPKIEVEQIVKLDDGEPGRKGTSTTVLGTGEAIIPTLHVETKRIRGDVLDDPNATLEAARQAGQIAFAINWTSEDEQDADIDLWTTSNGLGGELSFVTPRQSWGRLYRDILHSSDEPVDESKFRSWEIVTVDHQRLHDVTVWLNAYRTSGPVKITIIRVWNGEKKTRVIRWDPGTGDRASGKDSRRNSLCWLRVAVFDKVEGSR